MARKRFPSSCFLKEYCSGQKIIEQHPILSELQVHIICQFLVKVFLTVSQIKIYFCIDIHSKVILEQLLRSFCDANPSFNHVLF